MSNKFEKLIEYVINDEDQKASDLFHEIVVGKSREIYEGLMQDDIGGDSVDDFIDDVSADEEGVDYADDADDAGEMDFDDSGDLDGHEEGHDEIEDRVVDLEDKLDELMAEFDDLIGDDTVGASDEDEDAGEMDFEVDTDDEGEDFGGLDADEELSFEESTDEEIDEDKEELEEGAELTAAPKPTTSEEAGVNTKSANADDAGKKSKTDASPVKASTTTEKGRTAPKAKEMNVDGPEGGADLTKAPALKRGE